MKDPNRPKKPCSAYICFANAKRDSVCSANPGVPHTEIMKKLGEMWQAEKNRTPWEKAAAKDKARYEKEMASYVPPPNTEEPEKRKKDPNCPKKPKSAYLFFCDAERANVLKKHPEFKVTDVSKELGPAWQKLSAKAKTKYENLAAKDKERYEKEMASYTPPARDSSPKRRKKDPSAAKRPRNAFLLFSGAERDKIKTANPDLKITEISSELGKRWRAMSEAQKAPFVKQAEAEKAKLAV